MSNLLIDFENMENINLSRLKNQITVYRTIEINKQRPLSYEITIIPSNKLQYIYSKFDDFCLFKKQDSYKRLYLAKILNIDLSQYTELLNIIQKNDNSFYNFISTLTNINIASVTEIDSSSYYTDNYYYKQLMEIEHHINNTLLEPIIFAQLTRLYQFGELINDIKYYNFYEYWSDSFYRNFNNKEKLLNKIDELYNKYSKDMNTNFCFGNSDNTLVIRKNIYNFPKTIRLLKNSNLANLFITKSLLTLGVIS